jgi:hypothetical protein
MVSLVAPATIIGNNAILATTGPYPGTYPETFAGCGFSSAPPTAHVAYSVVEEQLVPGTGVYQTAIGSSVPCSGAGLTASNATGAGLTLACNTGYDFSGTVSFGTDNTVPLQDAIGTQVSPAAGSMNSASAIAQPECLYLPTGNYLTQPLAGASGAADTHIAKGYGCWLGDEHFHTNVFVIPSTTASASVADVFAWINSNANTSIPLLGNTQTFSDTQSGDPNQAGATFRNINVVGNRLSLQPQRALAFYGMTQFAYIDDVVVLYMNGGGIFGGGPNGAGTGTMAESVVQNARLEFDGSGTALPAMEFTSSGTAEGPNNLNLVNDRIFQPIGTGFWLNVGSSAGSGISDIRILNLMIEGSGVGLVTTGGDLLEIGLPNTSGNPNVQGLLGRNVELVNPPVGFAALHIAGGTFTTGSGNVPNAQKIDLAGFITSTGNNPDLGRGVEVDSCQQCRIELGTNTSADYNLAVGPPTPSATGGVTCSATIGSPLGLIFDQSLGTITTPSSQITTCVTPGNESLISVPTYGTFH